MNKIYEILVKLRIKELTDRPNFGALLIKQDLVNNPKWCSNFSTDGQSFYYNDDFVKRYKAGNVLWFMYHSLFHCILGNLECDQGLDSEIWDYAADAEVYFTLKSLNLGDAPEALVRSYIQFDPLFSGKNTKEIYDIIVNNSIDISDLLSTRLDTHLEIKENEIELEDMETLIQNAENGEDGSCNSEKDQSEESEEDQNKDESESSNESSDDSESSDDESEDTDESNSSCESCNNPSPGESGEPGDESDSESNEKSDSESDNDSKSNSDSEDESDLDDINEDTNSDNSKDNDDTKETNESKSEKPNRKDTKPDYKDQESKPILDSESIQKFNREFKSQLITIGQEEKEKFPGNMKRLVSEFTEPKVDWKSILTNTLQTMFDKDDYSFTKPSKRSYSSGRMDVILPGQSYAKTIDICVSIDSSGSITEEIFNDFVTEVRAIIELYNDYKLHIWCIDTQIYNPETFTPDNIRDLDSYPFAGGGGNDFDENWRYMKDNEIVPELFVVLSDGEPCGSWGDADYCETIFVIRNEYREITAPFGTTVQMIPQIT